MGTIYNYFNDREESDIVGKYLDIDSIFNTDGI